MKNKILELINRSEKILILTHVRPDADAVSSALALYWYLINTGKKSQNIDVIIPQISNDLSFIDSEHILKKTPSIKNYDLAIVTDCSDSLRVEGFSLLEDIDVKKRIVFDHHKIPDTLIEAENFIIDDTASSCTCILYSLFSESVNQHKLDFLKCIATGILSDTIFLSMNTTPECKSILDECSKNVNIDEITHQLKSVDERTSFLTELALERFELKQDFGCTYLLQSDLLDTERNLKTVNHKAMIEKMLKTVPCNYLIFLIENDNHEFKGSLRTSETTDLNEICEKLLAKNLILKGGGHPNSSGFRYKITNDIYKELAEAFKMVINEINDATN